MPSTASAPEVLAAYGPAAGLAPRIEPFPREGTLAERLAASPVLMAPMAGVTNTAYRLMARAGGAALAYTEMVSVAGIHYRSDKTWELVEPGAGEPDIAVQLFGSNPVQFREAAAKVAERLGERLVLIDVNMACPVPKVTRKGEGSALLDEPEKAAQIVRACREAGVPVTCKIRTGRTPDAKVGPEFAKALEQAGAAAVAVHGRTAAELYRGTANWDDVAAVAAAIQIPVIGSGDVLGAEAAVRMLRSCGVAAVFAARGTYGNPWLAGDACALLAGRELPVHDVAQRLAALELQVRLLAATGAHMVMARTLACHYFRGLPGASRLRDEAMACNSERDFVELVERTRREVL